MTSLELWLTLARHGEYLEISLNSPAVFSGLIPIPSSVIIALVAAGTLNYKINIRCVSENGNSHGLISFDNAHKFWFSILLAQILVAALCQVLM